MSGSGRAQVGRRRPLVAGLAVLLLAALAGVVPAPGGAAPASAAPRWTCEPNPTRGFTVLVRDDAELGGAEVEGTVAVGGTLRWTSTYDVRHSTGLTPPGYALPTLAVDGDARPVRVAAGALDLVGSSGVLQVGSAADDPSWPRGHLVVGSPTWDDARVQGAEVFVSGAGAEARVVAPVPPGPPAPADVDGWVDEYVAPLDVASLLTDWPALEADADLAFDLSGAQEGVSEVTLSGGPVEKQVALVAGDLNVLTLTPQALAGVTALSFTGAVPSADTALVVKLTGGTSFDVPRLNGASPAGVNLFAPWVLWTYDQAGPLTLDAANGVVTGSVLAPRAALELRNSSPVEGQVVARSLVKPGGTGEVHHYAFAECSPDPLPEVGAFTVAKTVELVGAFDGVPGEFTVAYWVDGVRQAPDLVVAADGTAVGPVSVPAGAVVELGELPPPEVLGGVWQEPAWAVSGGTAVAATQEGAQVAFAVAGGAEVAAQATNELVGQGLFSVRKQVEDPDGVGGAPATFTFAWWVDDVRQPQDLVVAADGSATAPLVVAPDAVVELVEVPPAAPAGARWEPVTWALAGSTPQPAAHGGLAFRVGQGSAVAAVTATNVLAADVAATGGFAVTKRVAGATAGLPAAAVFTGTWTCDAAGGDGASAGVWAVAAGGTVVLDGFPVGTTCTVAEDRDQPGGAFTAALAPADGRVVVAAGDPTATGLVTVTNTYAAPRGGGGGGDGGRDDARGDRLAATGAAPGPVGPVGAGLLLLGAALLAWHRRARASAGAGRVGRDGRVDGV